MTLPINIKDLTGLSEPIKKLIEVISHGVGAVYKPYLIRRTADAKAYEIKVLSEAISKNQEALSMIKFDEGKLSLSSIDKDEIKELPIESRSENRQEYQEQKKQLNIETITQIAAENLENEESVSEDKVGEDWTTRFFNYAQDISNEEMQELWGRILAGEIKQPKSYSLRTIELLRNFSKEDAEVFIKLSQFAFHMRTDDFLVKGNNKILDKFNIQYSEIALLQEIGLLHTGEMVSYNFIPTTKVIRTPVTIGDTIILLERKENSPEQSVSVILFTCIGRELLKLVTINPDFKYIQWFAKELKSDMTNLKYGRIIKIHKDYIEHTQPLIEIPDIE